MPKLDSQATSGLRWTSIAALCAVLSQFAQFAVLARFLVAEDFGAIAIAQVVLGFVSLLSAQFFVEAIIRHRDSDAIVVSSVFWGGLALGLLGAALILFGGALIALVFSAPRLEAVLPFVAIVLILQCFVLPLEALYQRDLLFAVPAMANILGLVATTAVAIGLVVFLGKGVSGWAWGLLAGAVARSAVLGTLALSSGRFPGFSYSLRRSRPLARFAALRAGASVSNFISSFGDQLVVGAMLGSAALGYYSLASSLTVNVTRRLNPVFGRVALPVLAMLQNDRHAMKRSFLNFVGLTSVVQAPVLLGIAATAEPLVALYLGAGWESVARPLQLLALYALARSIISPTGQVLVAAGKVRWAFRWNAALLAIVPTFVVFCAWLGGDVVSVAGGLVLLQIALVFIQFRILLRPVLGAFVSEYFHAAGRPLISAALMFLVIQLLTVHPAPVSAPVSFFLLVLIGILIYVISAFFLARSQLDMALQLIRTKGA